MQSDSWIVEDQNLKQSCMWYKLAVIQNYANCFIAMTIPNSSSHYTKTFDEENTEKNNHCFKTTSLVSIMAVKQWFCYKWNTKGDAKTNTRTTCWNGKGEGKQPARYWNWIICRNYVPWPKRLMTIYRAWIYPCCNSRLTALEQPEPSNWLFLPLMVWFFFFLLPRIWQ